MNKRGRLFVSKYSVNISQSYRVGRVSRHIKCHWKVFILHVWLTALNQLHWQVMCSKRYSFCLVFIMVGDCQEGTQKKALFKKTVCVDCMDGLVHECDNEKCVV